MSDGLDGAKGPLDGGLSQRVCFALRGMVGAELFEDVRGELGHVGCSLVCDDLLTRNAFSRVVLQRLCQDLGNELGAFVIVDDHRIEQVLVAAADILGCDQLEGLPKGL